MTSAPPELDAIKAVRLAREIYPGPQKVWNAGKHSERLLLSVVTLVLWLGCLTIGCIGIALPYARPRPPVKPPPPIQAEILKVELTREPLPPLDAPSRPPESLEPPPLIEPVTPAQAPPMIAVAELTPAVAFALPVEGPTRIVEAKEASYVRQTEPITPIPAPAPPVQAITYGEGEGKQPAPEYPRQAVREGQEGSVTVRFSVDENGRVIAAEAPSPSPWPLLNEAALRAVRQRWRFRPGPVRLYEVSIRFELKK